MSELVAYRRRLDALLAELAREHDVPGAVCGVLLGDEQQVAFTGQANLATGTEVTPDTLFQLGSISKLHTTCLVMQAHAAGLIALDEPVRSQLPGFAVADPGATIEITPRHLLTHTSGIEGDHLLDTGWNPDALERYVDSLPDIGQIHEVDDAYSFCNSGFGVAGRLVEEVTGENFDRALRRRLSRPLGAGSTLTLPQHLLLHRVAVGHLRASDGEGPPGPRWTLTRSNGPMGGIVATADDLLAFARMHLEGGRAARGSDVMSPAAVDAMQQPQVDSPMPGEAQALGWTVRHWDGLACLGQDADTFGQRAFLRVVPARRFAVGVLTNGPTGARLAHDLMPTVVGDLIGIAVPPIDARRTATSGRSPQPIGRYERLHQAIEVTGDGDAVRLTTCPSGILERLGVRPVTLELRPVDPRAGAWAATHPVTGAAEVVVFGGEPGAPAVSLHHDGRLHQRVTPRR